jgi:hypothetical protein
MGYYALVTREMVGVLRKRTMTRTEGTRDPAEKQVTLPIWLSWALLTGITRLSERVDTVLCVLTVTRVGVAAGLAYCSQELQAVLHNSQTMPDALHAGGRR